MKYDFYSKLDREGHDALALDSLPIKDACVDPNFSKIPMWVADMNFKVFPGIQEAVRSRLDQPHFGYFSLPETYYDRIIQWQKDRHDLIVRKEHIGYENGVLGGVASVIQTFTKENDPILVHSPTYIGFTSTLKNNHRTIIHSSLIQDENGIRWESTGLSGKDLSRASLSTDQIGQWVVSLEFNAEGAKKFADLTKELVGQKMAIFFDGELQSDPVIREVIYGGKAQISGGESGFEQAEAQRMVNLLNAGALPVPAVIVEENTVGPTLGADSIAKSQKAGIIGLSAVMIFMIVFYHVPGLIADVALIIYSLILFALFKTIPVTLTLAGIAGFILSIGMAVDANILIFERTKEELRAGRNLFTAINSGFDRAFTSIFDSNMTTIITCTILYLLGTSVVKGFALTLALGVIVSMFSAITVTKNFMHLIFGTGELKHPALFGLRKDEIGQSYEATETKREKARFGILD